MDIPNSVSVLHELLPVAVDMAVHNKCGVYNFTNPGVLSHSEIMGLYKEVGRARPRAFSTRPQIVDPTVTWEHFTEEEQSLVIKAPRSSTHLVQHVFRTTAHALRTPPS